MGDSQLEFKPGVLYSLSDIEDRLRGVMTVKTFLDNLGIATTGKTRMFERAVWGDEVINALREYAQKTEEPEFKPEIGRKRGAKVKAGLDPIDVSEVLDIGGKRA